MSSDFRVGAWLVRPSLNTISKNGTDVQVEPKVMEVLVCLASRPGESISKDTLIKAVWPDTFVSDDALIRCVSELRRVFEDDTRAPAVIQTIPKRGYRLLPAVTPCAGAERGTRRLENEFADSIAVLPFENPSADPEMEYLNDGVAETVINSLSRLKALRVVPRTTMFQYKGKFVDPARVGDELGVRLVLTGHITQRAHRLTLGIELIDTTLQAQLWGQTYDRKEEDIFSIQDEIAAEIVGHLRLRPTDFEKRRLARRSTESREAYHLYLRALYFGLKSSPEGLRKGFEYCAQAIGADPAFAEAYACLSYLYLLVGLFGGAQEAEAFAKAKTAALKALGLDDTSSGAHAALGFLHLVHDWDFQAAGFESHRAIRLGPNLEGGYFLASHLYLARRMTSEATVEAKVALCIDPLSVMLNYHLGLIYYYSRRYEEAIEQLRKAEELDPNFLRTHHILAFACARKGRSQDALQEAERSLALSEGSVRSKFFSASVHALLGKQLKARKILEEVKPACGPPYFVEAYACATTYAILGERDEAFEWLNNAWQGHATPLVYMRSDPNLENLHGDPRFDELVRRIGLS